MYMKIMLFMVFVLTIMKNILYENGTLGNVLIIFIYLFIFLSDSGEQSFTQQINILYSCIMLFKGTLERDYVAFFVFKVYFE